MLIVKKGNIFTSQCRVLVNTVNCVGVMGKGLAYEFRLRYPDMYRKYKEKCKRGEIKIGTLWIYTSDDGKRILNFPTKYHWKYPSKLEYIRKGLKEFGRIYKKEGIDSIAFPVLGSFSGGLPEEQVLNVMKEILSPLKDVEIEIYKFDPTAKDDLFDVVKDIFLSGDEISLSKKIGIGLQQVKKIKNVIKYDKNVNSIIALVEVDGVGGKTLEKLFAFVKRKFLQYELEF